MAITSKPDPAAKPAAAPPVVKTGGARPGTEGGPEAKAKKGKKNKNANRVPYPGLMDGDKPNKKLAVLPEDFDPKVHRPLKRANFDGDHLALKWQAKVLRDKATRLEEQAGRLEKLGNKGQASKLKRLAAMRERMKELEAELKDEDLDVEALLAELG